ncbi:uncharacterized protein LOC127253808 [Andrographis paniculata]|uniref:uncharacterized protein LOC127253808 n=1 Tax=Andrographis paniculata TaxID=175694 RepID=UPI0021E7435A|nr:uncharacterized protein LOC127253808 [Andrographis paniculata]
MDANNVSTRVRRPLLNPTTSFQRESLSDHLRTVRHVSDNTVKGNDLNPDEGNQILCKACAFPIFSTPCAYKNDNKGEGEGDYYHNSCANLPDSLKGHPLHVKPLLLKKHYDQLFSPNCKSCDRKCEGFIYKCPEPEPYCDFFIDVLCASTITIVHRSHQHELVPFIAGDTNFLFTCGACGSKHDKVEYYWCKFCNFYLHWDCALLPNTILHEKHGVQDGDGDGDGDGDDKHHALVLTYILPRESLKFQKLGTCFICNDQENLLSSIECGIYFCTRCEYAAHIKCATSDPAKYRRVQSKDAARSLIHLPMPDETTTLMYTLLKTTSNNAAAAAAAEEGSTVSSSMEKKIYGYDLILHDDENGDVESLCKSSSSCNACIEPILSNPFYSCPQYRNDFYLHACCANLPSEYQHPAHGMYSPDCKGKPLVLVTGLSGNFLSLFQCLGCSQPCNGFAYFCKACYFILDVKCASLPEAITYERHGKSHILFLSYPFARYDVPTHICQCCNYFIGSLFYTCCTCPNFTLHARCALLPSSVSHKFDKHRLELASTSGFLTDSKVDVDRDFCEICEMGIDTYTDSWFYHCEECNTLFHIMCIPCVGWFSKIKFGGTLRVRSHGCPVTCIRILTNYQYPCCRCGYIIKCREEDGIAFECTNKCSVWLCYDCAEATWIRS